MWRFKPFAQKEPTGLEGRYFEVGNLKIHVRNVMAEGGFSSVYLAQDAVNASKQYALKHIICNDEELLELVLKEISVMKSLKGHPNVVTLHAHAFLDMGRKKEAMLVMECCGKSLVNVIENRGAGYFEEKQVLSIFRDICNAVFAMHCQSPPIAHRDLKAENLLLGSDGQWKLCDFGSTSTNHKIFEKPEEMGIEEDNIRKHTTPAYRAPEMWDLFRRELINEKVDIWALGCLLFRICYFKNAFDGESKLQILNGNYRIPDLPKYSTCVTDLIRDMLQASPDDRPDITQVWFRVNEQLPVNLQKSLPDRPPEMQSPGRQEGHSKSANRSPPMPRRSPPPPPSGEATRHASQSSASTAALGAFWSTQHAKNSTIAEDKNSFKFDEDPFSNNTQTRERSQPPPRTSSKSPSPVREENRQSYSARRNSQGKSSQKPEDSPSKHSELKLSPSNANSGSATPNVLNQANTGPAFQNESFDTFVAEFDTNKFNAEFRSGKSSKEEALEAKVGRLEGQLKQANTEKVELTSKFEKLSAICRAQRQEIQELKQQLASRTSSSPNRDDMQNRNSLGGTTEPPKTADPNAWQPFGDEPKPEQQTRSGGITAQSVRTRNNQLNKRSAPLFDAWGFEAEGFTAVPATTSTVSKPLSGGNTSQRFGESQIRETRTASQPAGWAGF